MIVEGLPPGTTIDIDATIGNFNCAAQPPVCSFLTALDCEQPGGLLLGDHECVNTDVVMTMMGTGVLTGFNRVITLSASFEANTAPRTPSAPVQSFDADMFRLSGQLPPGDPDFDLLRITAGTDFGLPSPGHTTLTQLPGAGWAVDSFFDITYRIDFVGAPGSQLADKSGSTTGTVRILTGGVRQCVNTPVDCDDQNPCTDDECNAANGCASTPNDNNTCNDGNECTRDACVAGQCVSTEISCDDGDLCTTDQCESGCVVPDNGEGTANLPPQEECPYVSAGNFMITNGLPPGTTIEGPGNLVGFFPPASGVCSFLAVPPNFSQPGGTLGGFQQCSDNVMTFQFMGTGALLGFDRILTIPVGNEIHKALFTPSAPFQSFDTDLFRLSGELPPGDPDFDLLRITAGTDFGLPSPGHTTLTQIPGAGWAMDSFFDLTYRIDFDGAPGSLLFGLSGSTAATVRIRTTGGGGQCVHTPKDCDDGNVCTEDGCDPQTGDCIHKPIDATCDDGNECTRDACVTGQCVGTEISCDDGNACTLDACDPTQGCVHRAALCDDGQFCNGRETCDPANGCQAGTPPDCDDQVSCTDDACNEVTDSCDHFPDHSQCDDGNVCNGRERCDPANGCMEEGTPLTCDDQDACTKDECDPTRGCVHPPDLSCGECTRTIGYYKNHCEVLPPILTVGCMTYNHDRLCAVLNQKATKASLQLLHQLIAAILNGGNPLIDPVITAANNCLCNPNLCSRSLQLSLAGRLDLYNNSGEESCF
jgi:hypothetical protein